MEEILSVFAQEAREQLRALEEGLLQMEREGQDEDSLNAIFRAAHTIKGGAGVVELPAIERFTHVLENLLDKLRNDELILDGILSSALLEGCDHIARLLDSVEQGQLEPDTSLLQAGEEIAELLRSFTANEQPPSPGSPPSECHDATVERIGGDSCMADCWHISIRFGRDMLRMGMEPLAFLRYLQSLGEIVHLTTLHDSLPPAEDMDPEACYLGFEIRLRSQASKDDIENVFAFCRDESELRILPPDSKVADYLQLINQLPEVPMRIGEILVQSGAITQTDLDIGLGQQQAEGEPASPLGQLLVDRQTVQPEVVAAAAAKQKQVHDKRVAESRLIRVQADKLDQLIDQVGELVIAGASASLLAQQSGQPALVESISVLARLVEDVRDSALQLRMVQIGETFSRFNRVVRDTAKELGKEIELLISGAETELDKSVVEKIGDPLMHLVRNAMDHGIEPASVRLANGKPAKGRVELNAYHDSGSIVIEVVDDGGGIDADKIRAKALERGFIQPGQTLSEHEVVNLLFEAGFSTMETVSNLSGRGVGMDVVKRNIQALRGTIDVKTELGLGSRFIIRLPLTLAIIDGFLTVVGEASYVIPLDNVVECLELCEGDTRDHMLNLRGEVLPFIRLRELFNESGQPAQRENVVVIAAGGLKAGIVVDQLLGEFQTVIKPLGGLFRFLRGIGGSTILGSGEVALILDVQALIQLAGQNDQQRHQTPSLFAPVQH